MRRALILSMTVLAVVAFAAMAPAASALIASHHAEFSGWDFDPVPSGSIQRDATVDVSCPSGETFEGRVTLRTENHVTAFSGQIRGHCAGGPVSVHTFNERASAVACGVDEDLSGQVRSTDGAKFPIQRVHFTSCL
jgi:hypothetical protein